MTIHSRLSMGFCLNRERSYGGDWSGEAGKSFSSSCFYPTKMRRLFGARAEKFRRRGSSIFWAVKTKNPGSGPGWVLRGLCGGRRSSPLEPTASQAHGIKAVIRRQARVGHWARWWEPASERAKREGWQRPAPPTNPGCSRADGGAIAWVEAVWPEPWAGFPKGVGSPSDGLAAEVVEALNGGTGVRFGRAFGPGSVSYTHL